MQTERHPAENRSSTAGCKGEEENRQETKKKRNQHKMNQRKHLKHHGREEKRLQTLSSASERGEVALSSTVFLLPCHKRVKEGIFLIVAKTFKFGQLKWQKIQLLLKPKKSSNGIMRHVEKCSVRKSSSIPNFVHMIILIAIRFLVCTALVSTRFGLAFSSSIPFLVLCCLSSV